MTLAFSFEITEGHAVGRAVCHQDHGLDIIIRILLQDFKGFQGRQINIGRAVGTGVPDKASKRVKLVARAGFPARDLVREAQNSDAVRSGELEEINRGLFVIQNIVHGRGQL